MIVIDQDYCPNCFTVKHSGGFCPDCGYTDVQRSPLALPVGSLLKDRYIIGRVLGSGGFGITYLTKDLASDRYFAIKEFFPNEFAVRQQDFSVSSSSSVNSDVMSKGVEHFINEARALVLFKNSRNIVHVMDAFIENGTAYYAMEYLDGVNCKSLLRNLEGSMPLDYSLEILHSVLNALETVHSHNMLHRDVSLENIFVEKTGTVKLIDFGSARFYVGDKSRNLTVVLKPGYAPPEQYSSGGKQGPWTDIYSLASCFYHLVAGYLIPDAPDRISGKQVVRLDRLVPSVHEQTALAIEKALSLDFRDRYQTIEEFSFALGGTAVSAQKEPKRLHRTTTNPSLTVYVDSKQVSKYWLPTETEVLIGRARTCNVIVRSLVVSRQHCYLRYIQSKKSFFIRDTSTYGTFYVNGNRLSPEGEYIVPGTELYLASSQVRIRVDDE
ncbi:MAG: protein kinase [Coriobacteriia bacterium]|nr:protein kinase [Coriobacteriia bacterium]